MFWDVVGCIYLFLGSLTSRDFTYLGYPKGFQRGAGTRSSQSKWFCFQFVAAKHIVAHQGLGNYEIPTPSISSQQPPHLLMDGYMP